MLTGEAKVGILVASLVAAVVGTVLLLVTTRGREPESADTD